MSAVIVEPVAAVSDTRKVVAELLRSSHLRASTAPINYPDTDGRFPGASQLSSVWPRTPTVVPDANVLFRDIGRSAKGNHRTVLVSAANTGAIRILCPQFIIEEVYEHAERMAKTYKTTRTCYLDRFETEYLPLFRVVKLLPSGLWTPEEEARLEVLRRKDPDDVPAVLLALATGSIYLSTDEHALTAAYGTYDKDHHDRWVQILMAGGDAEELSQFIDGVWMLTYFAGLAATGSVRRLAKSTSGRITLATLAAAVAGYMASADVGRRKQLKSKLGAATSIVIQFIGSFEAAKRALQLAAVSPISETDQKSIGEEELLIRTLLYSLSGNPTSDASAQQLAADLSKIGLHSSVNGVRELLRCVEVFQQIERDRFQFGYAHPTVVNLHRSFDPKPPSRIPLGPSGDQG